MGVGGVIPPGVRKSFYFDQEYPDVSFRMLDYDMWSHPVAVRSIKNEAVRLEQHVLKPLSPDTDQKARASAFSSACTDPDVLTRACVCVCACA
jgi:hypothetical protein